MGRPPGEQTSGLKSIVDRKNVPDVFAVRARSHTITEQSDYFQGKGTCSRLFRLKGKAYSDLTIELHWEPTIILEISLIY